VLAQRRRKLPGFQIARATRLAKATIPRFLECLRSSVTSAPSQAISPTSTSRSSPGSNAPPDSH